MVYAVFRLRPWWVYAIVLLWEAYEGIVRQFRPDGGIFAPESWSNIAVDILVAVAAYHALRWTLAQALPRFWGTQPRAGALQEDAKQAESATTHTAHSSPRTKDQSAGGSE